MFSQHERRQLDEIEQWFQEWDPDLARKLTHQSVTPAIPTAAERTPIGLIVFLYAIGGLFLLLGVFTGNIVVIISGIAATTGGILTSRQRTRELGRGF